MLKVGLTGNIGSGKTFVAGIFEQLGAKVFNADLESRRLIESNPILETLKSRFGAEIITPSGCLNRKALASIVFDKSDELKFINKLVHPAVRKKFNAFCAEYVESPVVLYEAAIIIETGYFTKLDKLILVSAPEEIRLERVMKRDGATRPEVETRMKNQAPESEKVRFAHYIIHNDGVDSLFDQCEVIYQSLLRENANRK